MSQEEKERDEQIAFPKKVYASPTVSEYGSVAKLTRHGATSVSSDSGSNMMSTMPCL